jgi:hypothetical protein
MFTKSVAIYPAPIMTLLQTGDNQYVYNIGTNIAGTCKFFFNGMCLVSLFVALWVGVVGK